MISQKEQMLLQDQKSHEEMCVQKYTKYANEAQDQQLKQLFNTHAAHEKQHFNTLNQILNGQTPAMSGQGQQQQQAAVAQNPANQAGQPVNQNDVALTKDMLVTEKYISGTYDTVIFECQDHTVRQALNHIQKEEQQHGEDLFNYLHSRGAYPLQ